MKKFSFSNPDSKKRLDSLEAFIEYWVGPRLTVFGATDEQLANLKIPDPLRRLYKFCFNWPVDKSQQWGIPLLSRENVFVKLESTTTLHYEIPPGLVHFASENQGVTSWATLIEGEDPPVYGLDYEWGRFYNAPDGKEHRRWTEVAPSLTDFIIGFVLHELCISKKISIPISFLDRIYDQPEKKVRLTDKVHGHPVDLYLFDEDFLVFRWDWEESNTTMIAARNETTIAKLQQFAGSVISLNLTTIITSGDSEVKWQIAFQADGTGSIISSGNGKLLSRDTIPMGSIIIDEIINTVEPHLSSEKSEGCHTETKINRMVIDYMDRLSTAPISYLPNTEVQALLQKTIDFIVVPSLELKQQLKNGSPLDW